MVLSFFKKIRHKIFRCQFNLSLNIYQNRWQNSKKKKFENLACAPLWRVQVHIRPYARVAPAKWSLPRRLQLSSCQPCAVPTPLVQPCYTLPAIIVGLAGHSGLSPSLTVGSLPSPHAMWAS